MPYISPNSTRKLLHFQWFTLYWPTFNLRGHSLSQSLGSFWSTYLWHCKWIDSQLKVGSQQTIWSTFPSTDHPERLPLDTPYVQALPLAVDIPINDIGKGDIYIDDSIFVCPDLNNSLEQVAKAVPPAINSLARPLVDNEPLPRICLISMKKFLAEASLRECKTVLKYKIFYGTLTWEKIQSMVL